MIVFCEDCGKKNTITFNQIQNDMVDFHCESCHYHNHYTRRDNSLPPPFSTLSQFLKLLDTIPGITGSFMFHPSKGILSQRMPAFLNKEDLIALGYPLAQSYITSEKKLSNITDIKVILSNHSILMFHISNHVFLIVITDSLVFKGSFNDTLNENLILLKHQMVKQNGLDK